METIKKKKKLSVGNVDDKMVAKMASQQELSTQSENMGQGRTAQPLHNGRHSPPEMTCSPRPGCRKEERQHKSRSMVYPWSLAWGLASRKELPELLREAGALLATPSIPL